jgi:hypothetical protein
MTYGYDSFLGSTRVRAYHVAMIRKIFCAVLLSLLLLAVNSISYGASLPAVNVVVTNSGGKAVYKETMGANATFTTSNLEPGNYAVQFTSKQAGKRKFAIAVTAGKNNMSADSVAGEKFADPGVAMRVKVDTNTNITGHLAEAGTLAKQTQSAAGNVRSKGQPQTPVKIINGKRYIWVRPQSSTLEGGHWVAEDSPEAQQAAGNTRIQPGQQSQQTPTYKSGGMRY